MPDIVLGNMIIPYCIKRSKRRKTVAISVVSNEVVVTAPIDIEEREVEAAVKGKALWIRKQLLDFQEMFNPIHHRLFLSGEKLPYLGRQYRLKVIQDDSI